MFRFPAAAPCAANLTLLARAVALSLLAAPLAAQNFSHGISLAGLGNGAPGKSFGIAHEPTGDLLYVAVCGDFGSPNAVVAVIDPVTDLVVDTIDCGLFPQEIAFHYDAQGNLLHGMVSDSTSGTLTVWDAARQPLATIALPDPFGWGTCYPFDVIVVGDLAYVTTYDGSGDVHAVDLNALALAPAASLSAPGRSFARGIAVNGELWLPATQYTAAFTGAYGGLARLPLGGGPGSAWLAETADNGSVYPAGQEVLRLADGRAFLGGTSFADRLYVLDAAGDLARTIAIDTTGAQGLAVDATETLLAAVDNAADRVALVDLADEELEVVIGVAAWGSQPNDAVFAHGKLYVTCQGSQDVLVFDGLPQPTAGPPHLGTLTVSDTTPQRGDLVTVDLAAPGGLPVYLFASPSLEGMTVQGLPLVLGPTATLLAGGTGALSRSFTVPLRWPAGTRVQLQGAVDDGNGGATTLPATVIVQ